MSSVRVNVVIQTLVFVFLKHAVPLVKAFEEVHQWHLSPKVKGSSPGACIIKLITAVIYRFQ